MTILGAWMVFGFVFLVFPAATTSRKAMMILGVWVLIFWVVFLVFCRLYQEGRDDDDLNGRQDLRPIQAVESCHSRVVKLVGSGVGYRVWVLGCFMGDERVSETCLLSFGSVRPSTGVATANAQRLAQYCHRRVTPCFQTSKTSKAVVAMIYYLIKEFSQLSLLPDECTEGNLGKVAGRRVGKSRLAWYDTMPMRIFLPLAGLAIEGVVPVVQ